MHQVDLHRIVLDQVGLGQFGSAWIVSGQVGSVRLRSSSFKLGQDASVRIALGWVSLGQVSSGQFGLGSVSQIMLGHLVWVSSVQVWLHHVGSFWVR